METEDPPVVEGRRDLELRVFACGAEQVYPLEVRRLRDGRVIGVVTEVFGNSDLLRIAKPVADALDDRCPGAELLFRLFPGKRPAGTAAGGWEYAWSREGGRHRLVDLDELAEAGLDLSG